MKLLKGIQEKSLYLENYEHFEEFSEAAEVKFYQLNIPRTIYRQFRNTKLTEQYTVHTIWNLHTWDREKYHNITLTEHYI